MTDINQLQAPDLGLAHKERDWVKHVCKSHTYH